MDTYEHGWVFVGGFHFLDAYFKLRLEESRSDNNVHKNYSNNKLTPLFKQKLKKYIR